MLLCFPRPERRAARAKGYQLANVNLKANADVVSRIADALFTRRFADRARIEGDELAVLLAGAWVATAVSEECGTPQREGCGAQMIEEI